MPTAGERKFCTARPTACEKQLRFVSPAIGCQLVFVTKLAVILKAVSSASPGKPSGFQGSAPWQISRMKRPIKLTAVKASALARKRLQSMPSSSRAPTRRHAERSSGPSARRMRRGRPSITSTKYPESGRAQAATSATSTPACRNSDPAIALIAAHRPAAAKLPNTPLRRAPTRPR